MVDFMTIRAEGVELERTCGYCPVEYSGSVDGHPAYFRSRGTIWMLTIAETEDAAVAGSLQAQVLYERDGEYDPEGTGFGAGYMPDEIARDLILTSVHRWRAALRCRAGGAGEATE